MALTASRVQPNFVATLTRMWRQALQPNVVQGLTLVGLLSILVLIPPVRIFWTTVADRGLEVWLQVVASDLAPNLFWIPLFNTLVIGVIVGAGCIVIGGFLAWLVTLTDMPGRRLIGFLASLPFMLPNFALALAWETVMRNERVGGDVGVLHSLGVPIPNWLAWGLVPIALLFTAHYYSLACSLIAAALTSANEDLIEAGEMTGASRARVLAGILLPVVLPSMVAAGLLTFAAAVSAFATPTLLGAKLRSRYEIVTRYLKVDETLQCADLVFTAEGSIDSQTPLDKVPVEVALRAKQWGIPVFVLAGSIGQGAEINYQYGVDATFSVLTYPCTLEEAIGETYDSLAACAENVMRVAIQSVKISPALKSNPAFTSNDLVCHNEA